MGIKDIFPKKIILPSVILSVILLILTSFAGDKALDYQQFWYPIRILIPHQPVCTMEIFEYPYGWPVQFLKVVKQCSGQSLTFVVNIINFFIVFGIYLVFSRTLIDICINLKKYLQKNVIIFASVITILTCFSPAGILGYPVISQYVFYVYPPSNSICNVLGPDKYYGWPFVILQANYYCDGFGVNVYLHDTNILLNFIIYLIIGKLFFKFKKLYLQKIKHHKTNPK